MVNKLVIFGCGGHGKAVLDVVLSNKSHDEIIFVDPNTQPNEKILGFPVVKEYEIKNEDVFIASGDNKKRVELGKKYYNNLISIISKNAYIGNNVKIEKGVFVAHNAHIGILSEIKDFAIINTSASIDHECVISEGVFIAPNATICGKVKIGKNSFVGAGATIIDKIKICDEVTIGAGGVIVKDINEKGTYIGCPAKKGW